MEINFPTAIQENPAKLTKKSTHPVLRKNAWPRKTRHETDGHKIQAVDEAFKPNLENHTCALDAELFSDAIETSALRQNGNVAVHFSLHFDGLHDFESVCL